MSSTTGQTFEATLRSVITVLLIYTSGSFLVRFQLVDKDGVKILSGLARYLFYPLFYFVRLGAGMNLETLRNAWQLPVLALVIMLFNLVVAMFFLEPLAKPTKKFRRFFILSQTFSNRVGLPLVVISSMCGQVQFRKPEYLLNDEEIQMFESNASQTFIFPQEDCKKRGELYLFMYTLLVAAITWTIGLEYACAGKEIDDSTSETASATGDVEKSRPIPDPEKALKPLTKREKARNIGNVFLRNLKTPIMAGQFFGIVIGLIVPLQHLFFDKNGFLQPISQAADVLAQGTVSVINLILSVSFAIRVNSLEKWSDIFGNEESLGVSRRTLFWMVFGRMIFIPAIQFGILKLIEAHWFNFIPQGDQLLNFVTYLELFTPTANTVVVIAQIVGPTENAQIVALTILLQYLVGIVSITGFTFVTLLYSLDIFSRAV